MSERQGFGPTVPFDVWSEWFRASLGGSPAASLPPFLPAGPDQAPRGGGGPAAQALVEDPVMSSLEKLWAANPVQNVLPVDWVEISRALGTLWARELNDPQGAFERAARFNQKLADATVQTWQEAASRLWGLPPQEGEGAEEEGKGRKDKRFAAPEWEANPFYATLRQNYELASEYLLGEVDGTSAADGEDERKLRFHLRQFVDAVAPVNFFLLNPDAIKKAVETGGASVADGVRNLMGDLQEGRLSMTDATAFEPGENLAVTPGKVVYRNELIELIQYEPTTERVHGTPVMFIPPWINKYYILDLRPENSLVKHLVDEGFTVFMISWKNPDASMEGTTFDDYMQRGPLAAVEVVREITGSERVNPVGYCIGGTLLAVTLAWLAAGGDENPFGAPTFMVALQDFAEVGDTAVFIDEPQVEFMERQMMERGYLDNRNMSNMFNLLRSNDLIWSNVVNNYLLGQKPPAFDLLYWNSDGTRMAREAHSFYIRNTYLENNLVEAGRVEVAGRGIDLSRIDGEIYAVGAERDHIVPWYSAWRLGELVKGEVRFVLANSGHIAGMINPPSKGKGRYWTTENGSFDSADAWRERAGEHDGSWWQDWTGWLAQRSGNKKKPPTMGSKEHEPIEDAPGTYVKET